MTNLPEGDFKAELTLSGGTGRTTVQSPADVHIENGIITAEIVWSSSSYDLMIVDGKEYKPVSVEGGARFMVEIPSLDKPLEIKAETVAMSAPHMIDYTLTVSGKEILQGEDESNEGSIDISSIIASLEAKMSDTGSDTGTGSGQVVFSAVVVDPDVASKTTSLPPFAVMIIGAAVGAAVAFVGVTIINKLKDKNGKKKK